MKNIYVLDLEKSGDKHSILQGVMLKFTEISDYRIKFWNGVTEEVLEITAPLSQKIISEIGCHLKMENDDVYDLVYADACLHTGLDESGWELSVEIMDEIANLPEFETDLSKIQNVDCVKRIYGIENGEDIISFCLDKEPEKEGVIFTNKGMYLRQSDEADRAKVRTFGIKYKAFVYYMPYYHDIYARKMKLIGKHIERDNLSINLELLDSQDIQERIYRIFRDIVVSLISASEILAKRFLYSMEDMMSYFSENCERNN